MNRTRNKEKGIALILALLLDPGYVGHRHFSFLGQQNRGLCQYELPSYV